MVKKNKGWLFLLLIFIACPSPWVYSANRSINNLPPSQDMVTVNREYASQERILGVTDGTGSCIGATCQDSLNDTAKCNKCVDLQEDCPNCCLGKADGSGSDDGKTVGSGEEVINCTNAQSAKYICDAVPFGDTDKCDLVECPEDSCAGECTNYTYDSQSGCSDTKGTGGEPKSGATPYGLERKGCPNDLTPSGCSVYSADGNTEFVNKAGPDSIWECPHSGNQSSSLTPQKTPCDIDSSTGLITPESDYYQADEYVWGHDYSCSGIKCCGCSYQDPGQPSCDSKSAACSDTKSYSCNDSCCTAKGSCTPPPKGKCDPPCISTCTASVICIATPKITAVRYKLASDFKNYITSCVSKSDDYEKCADRVNCCQQGVCPAEEDEEGKCNSGFALNCDLTKCEKRLCYYTACQKYTGKSCAGYSSDAQGCLVDKKNCFEEIDPSFKYDFVARSAEALTITWQIVTASTSKTVSKGVNFYTLVKVWKLDVNGVTGDPVHTGMMNVKSLEAAFSIYGTTHIPVSTLTSGAKYRVSVYYFLPGNPLCNTDCDPDCSTGNELELNYISLTLIRTRE